MPTKIEWCDETWSPVTGCTPISEGCQHCWAARMAKRQAGRCGYPASPNEFAVTFRPERLELPLKWKKPRRIFVCSMGDLFHKDVSDEQIIHVIATAEQATTWIQGGQHTVMFLTKRPERMKYIWNKMFDNRPPIHHQRLWLGVTAENQARADERIPILLSIPAAMHFVSVEPMLGPVEFKGLPGIDWVIAGPETGPGARPCKAEWIKGLAEHCFEAGVPFFDKRKNYIRREWPG